MDGFFYRRSLYRVLQQPVPNCFRALEEYFAPDIPPKMSPDEAPSVGEYVTLAHNLCRRMGDVEYYSKTVSDELEHKHGSDSAMIASSLLVGLFSSCKGVIDAGAISLAKIYALGTKTRKRQLTNKEMDFARKNPSFWSILQDEQPTVHGRYSRFQGTFGEIFDWRDAAIHRVHPLVLPRLTIDSETSIHQVQGYVLDPDPDPSLNRLRNKKSTAKWVEPLLFHQKWSPHLLAFCKEVCHDIKIQSSKK